MSSYKIMTSVLIKVSQAIHFCSYFPGICLFFFLKVLSQFQEIRWGGEKQTNKTKWKHFNGGCKPAMLSNRDLKVGRKQQRPLLQKCSFCSSHETPYRSGNITVPPSSQNCTSLQCRTCSDLQQLTAVHILKPLNSSFGAQTNPTEQ